ncbi:aminopeptidase N [Aestuariimicrobium ganziense]|uniref:aminopeptidase N n=1 Tax=Aestuariimicrobium ganziense TaxID=2773677 RepID=UPI001941AC11|nr:aminopeptidase N [Aestuariimicrobium ganziense]
MNPANLTRAEAADRACLVTSESYRVHVDLTGRDLADADTFVSSTTVTFSSGAGTTWIDLIADRVLSAELDGAALDAEAFTGHRMPLELSEGDHELTIVALCRYSHTGEGLHRFVDPADQLVYLYTQFEIADARRMFACFDQPDLKATFTLSVLAPAHWTVVSNAPAVDPEPTDDDAALWSFEPTPPMSTYITALVAGDYHVVRDTLTSTTGEVPASVMCRQSVVEHLDAERILTTTQRGFTVFEEAFGVGYPFGTYDQVFVPEFNAGAMENAGCVTIRDEYLFRSRVTAAAHEARDNTILHELAHMWFGDLVTMTWWDDLWLNESFAEWASHYCQAKIVDEHGGVDPWVSFANARKGWAYVQDQMPTTHPIAADMVDLEAVEQNFDGITYAKGASVLKQLVSLVGEEQFLTGVRAYFDEHAWGNTQLTDLLGALETSSGRELGWFSGEWLEKAGVNTLVPEVVVNAGAIESFTIVQTADAGWPTLRTHSMAIGLFDLVDGRLVRRTSLPVEVSGERTEVPELVGESAADLVLLNDHDLTYAKVRLDESSLQTAVAHIDGLDEPLGRAILWGAAWDMCRDAEMASGDYVDLVLRGVGGESDLTAVGTLLRQAQLAATGYTARDKRAAVRERLVAGAAGLLKGAEPGSDHQLAFTNALVASVHTPAGAELIRGWLAGEEVPEGLTIDTDMRWRIMTALARMGEVGPEQIDALLAEDTTIQGAESAAGARAALPGAEAKATAWGLATSDTSVPNGTQRQIAMNFWQYDQSEVLSDYVDRYLSVADEISRGEQGWPTRGHAVVQNVLTWLFPGDGDEAVLARVDAWLTANDPSDQVKRTVTERRDALARALRCQAVS